MTLRKADIVQRSSSIRRIS